MIYTFKLEIIIHKAKKKFNESSTLVYGLIKKKNIVTLFIRELRNKLIDTSSLWLIKFFTLFRLYQKTVQQDSLQVKPYCEERAFLV